jgi:hypothetical protein
VNERKIDERKSRERLKRYDNPVISLLHIVYILVFNWRGYLEP